MPWDLSQTKVGLLVHKTVLHKLAILFSCAQELLQTWWRISCVSSRVFLQNPCQSLGPACWAFVRRCLDFAVKQPFQSIGAIPGIIEVGPQSQNFAWSFQLACWALDARLLNKHQARKKAVAPCLRIREIKQRNTLRHGS